MRLLRKTLILLILLPIPYLRADVSFEEGVASHLGRLTDEQLPGMAVLVARDGKVVFKGGFGFADVENKVPVTADTRFRIGSITKQFTAAAILRLADEGKLALTDPLDGFFPGFPQGITLHHLLTHTSGIKSYTDRPDFLKRVTTPIKPEDLIAWFRDDPPDFAPGAGFHYNNSAYFLLGEIVAKVSGKPFNNCLQEMFFGPLGMRETGVYENDTPPPAAPIGYTTADGTAAPAINWDMSWTGGAGALYSTVGDLFLWNEALFGGKVLKPSSFEKMLTPVKLPEGVAGMSYGYGLLITELNRLPAICHSGGLHGWSSDLIRLPEQQCTVIALANSLPSVAGFEPTTVTRKMAGKFLEADIRKLPPAKVDPTVDSSTYPDYVGKYDYRSAVLAVSIEDGKLFAQLTGQAKHEIFPSARDAFIWKIVDASITFRRNDDGKVTGATHRQNGATFDVPKID